MVLEIERKERAEARSSEEVGAPPGHSLMWERFAQCVKWPPETHEEIFGASPQESARLFVTVNEHMRQFADGLIALLQEPQRVAGVDDEHTLKMAIDLMEALDIGEPDLAGTIGVPVSKLQDVLVGRRPLSSAAEQRLRRAHNSLSRLLRIFRRDRVADVVRRPAELFGGSTALDLILSGRFDEVVELYDHALTYQS